MPNTKSAKKRMKQNEQRREYNRTYRRVLKGTVKRVRSAIKAGDLAQGDEAARVVAKKADQCAAKGVIHRNAAARIKSRVASALKKAKQASAAGS